MAYIDVAVNSSGDLVERMYVGEFPEGWTPGTPSSTVTQLPDRVVNYGGSSYQTQIVASDLADTQVSTSMASEPVQFNLPPEVQQLLGAGTNPFASLIPSAPVGSGGTPLGPATAVQSPPASSPQPAGSGGLLGIGGIGQPSALPTLNYTVPQQVTANAELMPDWSSSPLGKVFTSPIRNRQISGVRRGTLPMVVMRGGRGGY